MKVGIASRVGLRCAHEETTPEYRAQKQSKENKGTDSTQAPQPLGEYNAAFTRRDPALDQKVRIFRTADFPPVDRDRW